MILNLDTYLGIRAKALITRDHRASQLANNLTNANTPNYKAMNVDFNEYLSASVQVSAQQMADEKGFNTSNVNYVEEMANMISVSSFYQMNIKLLNTTKQLMQQTLQLSE